MLFSWTMLTEQWPYIQEQSEGMWTGVAVADEPSRLFLAVVFQHEARWKAALLLDGVHEVRSAFLTPEEAQEEAEQALTTSLRTCGLFEDASPLASFDDDPFYEVATLLLVMLDDEMHISHLSEYKRTWVAVCISRDGTRLEDYVFGHDSHGVLGARVRGDRLEVRL